MTKPRHQWGDTDLTYRQLCVKCGCQKTQFRRGKRSYKTKDGHMSWYTTPPCVQDTPLLKMVRSYISKELTP